MLAEIISSSFIGVNGYIVNVEVDISNGLPNFSIVGMGDTAIAESRERIRPAIKNSGIDLLPKRIVVNLSPADISKKGASFDLPIAVGILASLNVVKKEKLKNYMIIGELSLGGEIKGTRGIINNVITAKENLLEGIIIPYENAKEASMISGIKIIPVKKIKEIIKFLNGEIEINIDIKKEVEKIEYNIDFDEVKGQTKAKRGIEISAAGGHNIFMSGSPGSGKSMLAKRIITILPKMTEKEIIESTKIHSISGYLTKGNPIINRRPFRTPHHTSSDVALIGGGRFPRPGEISLAHNGVLFLDEMPEFSRKVLEVLRQPLEDKKVSIARANFNTEFPADFILVGTSNPCPCGFLYEDLNSPRQCTCSATQIRNYQNKLSGPIMDRMDLNLEIKRLNEDELLRYEKGESSESIKKRVENAREHQKKRGKTNANLTNKDLKKYCKLDLESEEILKMASRNLGLSARGFDKILKVARTIADLENAKNIKKGHVIEAISYRR